MERAHLEILSLAATANESTTAEAASIEACLRLVAIGAVLGIHFSTINVAEMTDKDTRRRVKRPISDRPEYVAKYLARKAEEYEIDPAWLELDPDALVQAEGCPTLYQFTDESGAIVEATDAERSWLAFANSTREREAWRAAANKLDLCTPQRDREIRVARLELAQLTAERMDAKRNGEPDSLHAQGHEFPSLSTAWEAQAVSHAADYLSERECRAIATATLGAAPELSRAGAVIGVKAKQYAALCKAAGEDLSWEEAVDALAERIPAKARLIYAAASEYAVRDEWDGLWRALRPAAEAAWQGRDALAAAHLANLDVPRTSDIDAGGTAPRLLTFEERARFWGAMADMEVLKDSRKLTLEHAARAVACYGRLASEVEAVTVASTAAADAGKARGTGVSGSPALNTDADAALEVVRRAVAKECYTRPAKAHRDNGKAGAPTAPTFAGVIASEFEGLKCGGLGKAKRAALAAYAAQVQVPDNAQEFAAWAQAAGLTKEMAAKVTAAITFAAPEAGRVVPRHGAEPTVIVTLPRYSAEAERDAARRANARDG